MGISLYLGPCGLCYRQLTVAVRSRPLAIATSIGYLLVGFAAWAVTGPMVESHSQQSGGIVVALWAGSAILAVLAWRLPDATGVVDADSTSVRDISSWMLPAVVGPLALYPLALTPGAAASVLLAILWPLSPLPLALTLGGLMRRHRLAVRGSSILLAVVAVGLGSLPVALGFEPVGLPEAQFLAVWAIAGFPASILLASPRFGMASGSATLSANAVTDEAMFAVAGLAPALGASVFILPWATGIVAIVVAMGVVALAGRLAVRPLAWVAARADSRSATWRWPSARPSGGGWRPICTTGRSRTSCCSPGVSSCPAIRRAATMARGIGDELRELSGDLRLPMLDDLGVGPALDWLAGRIQRMTGVEIRVEDDDRWPRRRARSSSRPSGSRRRRSPTPCVTGSRPSSFAAGRARRSALALDRRRRWRDVARRPATGGQPVPGSGC